VGLIIGRQGDTLRRVESDTGARVQFLDKPDTGGSVRLCRITGSRSARSDAKAQISHIISENGTISSRTGTGASDPSAGGHVKSSSQPPPRGDESTMQIMVPDRTVGLIIGRGGETIRDLQERSGCHVNIVSESKSVNGLRPVNLTGTAKSNERARDLIIEIVDSDIRSPAKPSQRDLRTALGGSGGELAGGPADKISDTILVPGRAVGMIIGKGR
jgi:far upstream element-binding protein